MTMIKRHYTHFDQLICSFQRKLGTWFAPEASTNTMHREYPSASDEMPILNERARVLSEQMIRVDHSGEVCAQALYQGQALTTHNTQLAKQLKIAAQEENDHLAWCEQRLKELAGRTSYLNFFWYSGSLIIGVIMGLAGDAINLGFLAETERQVTQHLQHQLTQINAEDTRSIALIKQMAKDETKHAHDAIEAGGIELPKFGKWLMHCLAKCMTTTAKWI